MISKKKKSTILVIDDDETLLDLIRTLLVDAGYNVKIRANGDGIKQVVLNESPDLILLDYSMPGMTGAEITEEIKKTKEMKHIPIIMLAAGNQNERLGYRSGINKFIAKPFDIDYLLGEVRKHLRK